MNDDECIEEAEIAVSAPKEPKPRFSFEVTVHLDIAELVCAIILPPALVAMAWALT